MKMFHRKIIYGSIFMLLVILCIIVNAAWKPPEPSYEGRTLSAWTKDLFFAEEFSKDPRTPALREKHEQAVAAIQHMRIEAMPFALKLCRAKDSWLKKKLEDLTADYSDDVLKYRITPAWEKQEVGGNIIWALGPMAKPAVPDLLAMLKSGDRDIAPSAGYALQGIGIAVIPPLIELLNHTNKEVRLCAMVALGHFRSQARAAIPTLLHCLENPDPATRSYAARLLGQIKEDAPVVVPAIIRCMQNDATNINELNYFWALGNFGTNGKSAVPALIQMLESKPGQPDAPLKGPALVALWKIDPKAAQPFVEKTTNPPILRIK